MTEWSKVPSLTARCLSPLPEFECEKVASDLGLGGGFHPYSGFPNYLQLASHK